MLKKVIFFDKHTGGHRPSVQRTIIDYLRSSNYDFEIVNGWRERNSLTFLRECYRDKKFDHCHMLTLDDCIEDFYKDEEVLWFKKAEITLSGTLYKFTFLTPHIMLTTIALSHWYRGGLKATVKAMRSGIIKNIAVPDERLSQVLRYPVWRNKLRILPDSAEFSNDPPDCQKARLDLGWDRAIPTLLMFGTMHPWKGLDLLLEALSAKFSDVFRSPLRVVLAGQQVVGKINVVLSSNVDLIEYNRYIEDAFAKQLFAAADCVVMPFVRDFEWSSGTFSLACASGKFVILPNNGVLGWRARNLRNGYVYQAGNSASLAKAIARFVEDYPKLTFPIEGSMKYAAECTPIRYVERLDRIISESLDSVRNR